MNHYDSDHDLDRALFALELEEPPANLRAAILARTVYRQPIAVKPWEIWTIGAIAALVVWLVVLAAQGSLGFERASSTLADAIAVFARPEVLFWTALGASVAFWISQLNLTALPGALPARRR